MKQSHFWPAMLKIAILTSMILGCFQVYNQFFSVTEIPKVKAQENTDVYRSAYSADFGNIWVALSTRVGIWYQDPISQTKLGNFYKEISTIGETSAEKKNIRLNMISENMLIISEYLNISRTDIKGILDSSNDRRKTLEGFISQLEMRFKNSIISITNLENQKARLVTHLSTVESDIERVKANMETNFASSKAAETLLDVDKYIELRREYTETFTDIVFINQFLKQHAFLNNYNKGILDTVINNKEAIINQTYVVIPDSGEQYLRPLDLIFDEADIKAKQSTEE